MIINTNKPKYCKEISRQNFILPLISCQSPSTSKVKIKRNSYSDINIKSSTDICDVKIEPTAESNILTETTHPQKLSAKTKSFW
jgi:hypothetical protein